MDISRIEDADQSVAATTNRAMFGVMRTDVAPFDSVEFRHAVNYAVDVETIIEELLNGFGEPLSQPVFEGVFGYNPDLEPYPYDPDQAAQLVEESGYAGVELTLQTPVGRVMKVAHAVADYVSGLLNVSREVEQRGFSALISVIVDGN